MIFHRFWYNLEGHTCNMQTLFQLLIHTHVHEPKATIPTGHQQHVNLVSVAHSYARAFSSKSRGIL